MNIILNIALNNWYNNILVVYNRLNPKKNNKGNNIEEDKTGYIHLHRKLHT
jgi:hypothetical protein